MKDQVVRILIEGKGEYYLATCLDFNLMAEGSSSKEALDRLKDSIFGYVDAVLDTADKVSIARLLHRPAPLSKRLKFWIAHKIHLLNSLKAMTFDPWQANHPRRHPAHA